MLKKHALAKEQDLPAAFPSLGCAHVLPWYPAAWQELSLPTRSGQSYIRDLTRRKGCLGGLVLAGETEDFFEPPILLMEIHSRCQIPLVLTEC